jgi:flagellar biosynthesis protein FlhB
MGGLVFLGSRAFSLKFSPLRGMGRIFRFFPAKEGDDGSLGLLCELGWRAGMALLHVGILSVALGAGFLVLQRGSFSEDSALAWFLAALPIITGAAILCAVLIAGVAGFYLARWRRRRRLFMSRDELIRELRENEGDPHLSWMRRELHRELVRESAIAGVRRASLVVTGRARALREAADNAIAAPAPLRAERRTSEL